MDKIIIPDSLKRFADSLGAPLYLVGGNIRNAMLGLAQNDFDICGGIAPEKVIATTSNITIDATNKASGSLVIKAEGGLIFEYTAFRRDEYEIGSGKHYPQKITFIDSLFEDALRRDFKMNAIYCDIQSGQIIDPLGGAQDVKGKLITATRNPETVFAEDPQRILRALRFAVELGFKLEKETKEAAKKFAPLLKGLSAKRLTAEFSKIFDLF